MKKKLVSLSLALTLFFLLFSAFPADAAAAPRTASIKLGSPTAFVNSERTWIDVSNEKVVPYKTNKRTMVPLRFCVSAMGGSTKYTSDDQPIYVTVGTKSVRFKIGSDQLEVATPPASDGSGTGVLYSYTMDTKAVKVSGRVMIPVRAISQALGFKVFYTTKNKAEYVIISNTSITQSVIDKQIGLLSSKVNEEPFGLVGLTAKQLTDRFGPAVSSSGEEGGEFVYFKNRPDYGFYFSYDAFPDDNIKNIKPSAKSGNICIQMNKMFPGMGKTMTPAQFFGAYGIRLGKPIYGELYGDYGFSFTYRGHSGEIFSDSKTTLYANSIVEIYK